MVTSVSLFLFSGVNSQRSNFSQSVGIFLKWDINQCGQYHVKAEVAGIVEKALGQE